MTFRFRTLGGVSLEGPDGPVTGRAVQRRRLAVLSLLAAAPSATLGRDQIIGLLWPETDQAKARHLLSNALYALRKALGEEAILSCGDEELRLEETLVWTDVGAFEAAVEEGDFAEAVELYRGPFLDGFHVSAAAVFERWQDRKARQLASLYGEALERLAREAQAKGDPEAAVRWWKRRAAQDPYDSRVAHALMRALSEAGNPAAALRHARVHELMLRDELGLEPSDEVRALADDLRARNGVAEETAERTSEASVGEDDRSRDAFTSSAGAPPDGLGADNGGASRSPSSERRWSGSPVVWGAAAVVLLGLVSAFLVNGLSTDASSSPTRLILADFEDLTPDSLLGPAVTEAVRIDLSQSRSVSLAEPSFVRSALERMKREVETPVTPSVAREIAVREGLDGSLTGAVRPAGSGYLLTAEVQDPHTGESVEGVRETAAGRDELIGAIDSLGKKLRQRLGERPSSLGDAVPLERATTASLEALELYSQATRLMYAGARFETVRGLLEEAIALDSTFALAYRRLSSHLGNAFDRAGAVEMARKAYRHRGELPERERWLVEGWYHTMVTDDHQKAIAAYERILAVYPDQHELSVVTSIGNLHREEGNLEKAATYYRRSIEADSVSSFYPYWNLSLVQVHLGELEAAERTTDAYERIFVGRYGPQPSWRRRAIAAARNDYDRAIEIARENIEQVEQPFRKYYEGRFVAYYHAASGRLRAAEEATRRAALHVEGANWLLAAELAMASVELWAVRDTAGAVGRVTEALRAHPLDSMKPSARPYDWVVRILGSAGRMEEARRHLAEASEVDRSVLEAKLRAPQRRIALAHVALGAGDPAEAIEQLEPVVGRMREGRGCWDYRMACPLYPMGRAYEMAGRTASAIEVYERFVHAPFNNAFYNAFYRADVLERLASLYEDVGEPEKAARAYGLLVELWKDCDPVLRPRVETVERRARSLLASGGSP
jgi:DNA-binding SARP family transcriptional activator